MKSVRKSNPSNPWHPWQKILGLSFLFSLIVQNAVASINVQNFYPALGPRFVFVEGGLPDFSSSESQEVRALYLSAFWNYLDEPLVVLDSTRSQQLGTLVNSVNTFNLGVGYGLSSNVTLHVNAPIHWVGRPNQSAAMGFGDIQTAAQFRLLDTGAGFGLSIIPDIRFPSGSQNLSVSDGTASVGFVFAAEIDLGGVSLAANAGYRYAPGADFLDLSAIHRIPLKAGLFAPFGDSGFGANLEASLDLLIPFNSYVNPGEVYGGINWKITDETRLYAGASFGSLNSVASSDYRLIAGVRVIPLYYGEKEKNITPPAPKPEQPPVQSVVIEPVKAPVKPRVVFKKTSIEISEEVKFEHAKDVLTESGRKLLDEVADEIKKNKGRYSKIVIEGHCNELGTEAYNLELSKARALSVKEYLGSRGIDRNALDTVGYGESQLKSVYYKKLSRESQLAMDRRVAFKVVPPAKDSASPQQ